MLIGWPAGNYVHEVENVITLVRLCGYLFAEIEFFISLNVTRSV